MLDMCQNQSSLWICFGDNSSTAQFCLLVTLIKSNKGIIYVIFVRKVSELFKDRCGAGQNRFLTQSGFFRRNWPKFRHNHNTTDGRVGVDHCVIACRRNMFKIFLFASGTEAVKTFFKFPIVYLWGLKICSSCKHEKFVLSCRKCPLAVSC